MARRGHLGRAAEKFGILLDGDRAKALTRVRERRAESGSLKPMWPAADAEQLQINAAARA